LLFFISFRGPRWDSKRRIPRGERPFIIGGTCAIEAKILAVARLSSLVTRYEERSKNFFKESGFSVQVDAVLIELLATKSPRHEERLVTQIADAAGGRPREIANSASHGAGNEETKSKYAEGIRVKQYPSRRQHEKKLGIAGK
jgi:hypothetical protein